MHLMSSLSWITDTQYSKMVTCKLPAPHITTPKTTNLKFYQEDLKANVGVISRVMHGVWNVELAADILQQAIFSSHHQNYPASVAHSPRMVPWWNKELSGLKATTRWFFNLAKRKSDWESYKMAFTYYNKELRKAKWFP